MNCVNFNDIDKILTNALKEDIGSSDITTNLVLPKSKRIKAEFVAKENFVLCGINIALRVFTLLNKNITVKNKHADGDYLKKDEVIAAIYGDAKTILAGERVALNFIGLLSGISTYTSKFVSLVKPHGTKILDTRKTIPGLRILEKYAVRIGGGYNHRMRLDEMILIKDNHISLLGGIKNIQTIDSSLKTEIEVKNMTELKTALLLKPDVIMLDNMSITDMKKAVSIRNKYSCFSNNPQPKLEASGNISLNTVKKVALTGVDMISIGALTHSVTSVDISLEIN